MIIIADTSSLIALALCESLDILNKLFEEVKVSNTVFDEACMPGKPKADILEKFLKGKVVDVDQDELVIGGKFLDIGELSSILLYQHLKADYLLIDEQIGRRIAKLNHVKVIGSLGVLIEAKNKRIISTIKPQIEILKLSKIYFSQDLLNHALKLTNEDTKKYL
ncbi:MAG: DUF3368 domain-containing protein [Candidatus Anammoxibacter sp.]